MRALSAPELLDVWERGLAQPPVQRVLTLLAAACSELSPEALATLSIGKRDARLLTLREWTFGPRLVGLAKCPGCDECLEVAFNLMDLHLTPEIESAEILSLNADGYEVSFRLPNSLDLAAATNCKDIEAARQLLLERCITTIERAGIRATADQVPATVAGAITERMAQADPQADVQIALTCPMCVSQWQAMFDIESFFWNEIRAWAQGIMMEVHKIASAYGWREVDILNMSPWRRQFYLNLVSE